MGFRYTMVDYNTKTEVFDLYCYENDICVINKAFDYETDALDFGDKFLNNKLGVAVEREETAA